MSGGSVFDHDASRKLEAAYLTPDVVAQRRKHCARSHSNQASESSTLAQDQAC
jgi:hypothetical protein